MRLATASQMRESDRYTIEDLGLPGIALMETAAVGAVAALLEHMASKHIDTNTASIGIFCGSGNNGGDGFVIARELLYRGFEVRVYLASPRQKTRADAATNLNLLERIIAEDLAPGRGLIKDWGDALTSGTTIGSLLGLLPAHNVVIDALLGGL